MPDAPFKAYNRRIEVVALLLTQGFVQFLKPFFLLILTLLKLLQIIDQITISLYPLKIHFKVMCPAKTTSHEAFDLAIIVDSTFSQLALEVKPFSS